MNLTLRIFLALLAGLVVGALLPADIGKPLLPATDAIGNLWLQALQMTIIPLIAGLLFTGIAQSVDQAGGGKVAGRALLAFLALLIFSALWSMIFVPLLLDWWPAPPAAAAAIVANSAGAAPVGDIKIDIGNSQILTASITNEAVDELALKIGDDAWGIIKASDVIVAK